ncbi:Hermansky-Pudlak syndrome 5 protein [Triplophysa tibetana]|uniref:Hermansky-Pudlak syndrome 5 protein homolog n=1 Tax=Triplophysa tibetana TaxID=1572043 RepID=A0A5A9PRG0_9TELE|nr:Hermansky-Pudlak syndrome 5 protein [Triplophysa tibetana]
MNPSPPMDACAAVRNKTKNCTCVSVSRKWLALGTSAGGLHLIQREGWKQRHILPHKEGSITQVLCCPHDEDFIAVATSQGLVVVWELHVERRGRPERACTSWEHRGTTVTSLCWDTATLRVFAGDVGGKVSCVRAGSSKLGKGSAFVIFPVQNITKGQWGQPGVPPPLLYCARPGSRVWEASFGGDVLSTHQFKQLLACPPLPLISYRNEPHFNATQTSPQSLAFPRLLQIGDQHLLTWTDSAIYIFTPHSGQVLLWTEVKDVMDIAVFQNELFCLHDDGRLSHLSLLSPERCVERLMKRENWTLAATVCCMFQNAARKSLPTDRLEQLKVQLNPASQQQLIGQVEEVISKLEPLDSACSSRRSSISSHESFNVLDCGIYRVISRRGSQSDDDTNSIATQTMLEEERLKEFSFTDEQVENDSQSVRGESDRSDPGLQFLPLSFRPKPPRALQAVRDSVSSFMKKTTEKINTLQMNSDLWPRPDLREGVQGEVTAPVTPLPDEGEHEANDEQMSSESELQELRVATQTATSQIHDPLVLLDPVALGEVLGEWALVLERVLGPEDPGRPRDTDNHGTEEKEQTLEDEGVLSSVSCCIVVQPESLLAPPTDPDQSSTFTEDHFGESGPCLMAPVRSPFTPFTNPVELIQLFSPKPLPPDLHTDLSQLACLYLELDCPGRWGRDGEGVCVFLRRYFFLLDQERVRNMCTLRYGQQPDVRKSYIAGMMEFTQASKVVEVIQKGDLLKSLRSLRDLQPWNAPLLLSHLYRLYEKHGEVAVRAYPQFYPTILPSDIMAMALPNHFLPYLDNLVQSRSEQQRLSFLGSLLQPESLQQDWLELALSHDAPQRADTLTPNGRPRWRSHFFSWGYGRLLSLLIRLPSDLRSKQKMLETCRSHGYWMGYLYLCRELQQRTLDEWVLLLQLSQQISSDADEAPPTSTLQRSRNGSVSGDDSASPDLSNGSGDRSVRVSPENIALRLVRVFGPDGALETLQECGIQMDLSPRSTLVCDLLRMTEKRQRALIQTMLERCDRFLWSQHA